MAFSGFLSSMLIRDVFISSAEQLSSKSSEFKLYKDLYAKGEFKLLDGSKLKLADIKTNLVIMNFWAGWCVPCILEFKTLSPFMERYQDKITFVGINGDDDEPAKVVKEMTKKHKLIFKNVLDPKSKISDQFMISTYPHSIIFLKGEPVMVFKKIHDFMSKDFLLQIENYLKVK